MLEIIAAGFKAIILCSAFVISAIKAIYNAGYRKGEKE